MEVARCPTISGGSIAKAPISFFIQPVLKLLNVFNFAIKDVRRVEGILTKKISLLKFDINQFSAIQKEISTNRVLKFAVEFCRNEMFDGVQV